MCTRSCTLCVIVRGHSGVSAPKVALFPCICVYLGLLCTHRCHLRCRDTHRALISALCSAAACTLANTLGRREQDRGQTSQSVCVCARESVPLFMCVYVCLCMCLCLCLWTYACVRACVCVLVSSVLVKVGAPCFPEAAAVRVHVCVCVHVCDCWSRHSPPTIRKYSIVLCPNHTPRNPKRIVPNPQTDICR